MAIDEARAPSLRLDEVAAVVVPGAATTSIDPTRGVRPFAGALVRSKTFVVGALILAWWSLDAALWWLFVPQDPQSVESIPLQGPSAAHWFGTDDLGRDVFSRVLAGASSVLTVAPVATALALLLGIAIGLVAGYYRGFVDEVLMRLVDALLAFPLLIVAVLVLAVLGGSTRNVILVIAVAFAPKIARTVRAAVLVEREREYVAAAKLRGESGRHVMFAEILPNITGPIAVEATTRFGFAIFAAATVSFLGLGLQQPSPDWGLSIALGRGFMQVAPWIVLFPVAALASLVVAVNLVADAVAQVVDE